MIQIRQKKQNQRQERRRQFLDTYFRDMRKKFFNFDRMSSQNTMIPDNQNEPIIETLLKDSLKQNYLSARLRQSDLLSDLREYTEIAIKDQNFYQTKFLLTIIINMIKDDLKIQEIEQLFKISMKLFQSLRISNFRFDTQQRQRQNFERVSQKVTVQILMFYMNNAQIISKSLEESEQVWVQNNIYPAFITVIFSALNDPTLITSKEFLLDSRSFLQNIFDKNQDYEMGNRMKVQRNRHFFREIVKHHQAYLRMHNNFQKFLQKAETQFFWLYQHLTKYIEVIKELFQSTQFTQILFQSFKKQIQSKEPKKIIFIYSIFRTFIDQNMKIAESNELMLSEISQYGEITFKKVIAVILERRNEVYGGIQFIQGIMISFYQKGNFQALVNQYSFEIIDLCLQIIQDFEVDFILDSINRSLLYSTLSIIYIFLQNQNVNTQSQIKEKSVLHRIQSSRGMVKIQQMGLWFKEIDSSDSCQGDSNVDNIKELINWILLYNLDAQFDLCD